ncbi:hypothetical protein RMATCC62417_02876 [Rhizopus microsporus]|nr:hypothetical protein RMATCC62417_02876 [Rhizopus microsporus]
MLDLPVAKAVMDVLNDSVPFVNCDLALLFSPILPEHKYETAATNTRQPKLSNDIGFAAVPRSADDKDVLLKEELTCEKDALLELSLSGIYNYLNPYMKKVYQEKLNRSPPSTIITTTTATNSVAEAMTGVRNLLDSKKDMNDILYKVQLEKARLVKEKLRHSDMYKALEILEKVQVEQYMEILNILLTTANYH